MCLISLLVGLMDGVPLKKALFSPEGEGLRPRFSELGVLVCVAWQAVGVMMCFGCLGADAADKGAFMSMPCFDFVLVPSLRFGSVRFGSVRVFFPSIFNDHVRRRRERGLWFALQPVPTTMLGLFQYSREGSPTRLSGACSQPFTTAFDKEMRRLRRPRALNT